MRSIGYAVLLSALVGGGLFMLKLMNGLARDQCGRNCPKDAVALVTVFRFGPVQYQECRCP